MESLQRLVLFLASGESRIDTGIEGSFDFGSIAELHDRAALEAFSSSPAHVAVAMDILAFRDPSGIVILDLEL